MYLPDSSLDVVELPLKLLVALCVSHWIPASLICLRAGMGAELLGGWAGLRVKPSRTEVPEVCLSPFLVCRCLDLK